MMHNRIHVSTGNTKLGKEKTGNISLLPVVTCITGAPCAKDCYARRLAYSPEALKAWTDNTAYAINDVWGFMQDLSNWIDKKKPTFFRWHTSGDVPTLSYASGMMGMAIEYPDTTFLCFTKRYDIDWTMPEDDLPIPNLIVYHSAWEGLPLLPKKERLKKGVSGVAYLEGDSRIPDGTQVCKGQCDTCRYCWNIGNDVVLHKH